MATKEEKDTYKGDPKLLLEALTGAPGKNGPCPLTKAEAAFYVWNYAVVSPSRAAELHDAIPLLVPMLKNPDASDEMRHNVAGALAYLARVEEHARRSPLPRARATRESAA